MSSLRVVPIPNQKDNYAYLVIDSQAKKAAVVDPFDIPKVLKAAEEEGVEIESLLTTHHHFDHSGGNQKFAEKYPNTPIFGGSEKIPKVTKLVGSHDIINIGSNLEVRCLHTPCHTQDSICYHVTDKTDSTSQCVFTGDTLFQAGCGRFFEGTPTEMNKALNTTLGALPDDTIVYSGHEYTKSNLAFARSVDPSNPAHQKLQQIIDESPISMGKSTIGDEKKWNPFMRLHEKVIQEATGTKEPDEVMKTLRIMKNEFKG